MKQLSKRSKRLFIFLSVLILVFSVQFTALAADDPLSVVNNLSDFIFSIIRAVGLILLGFGILQLGLHSRVMTPRNAPMPCLLSLAGS